ncbi:hypothetical protein BRD20_08095 [Halobacteriales archaeon SW_8_65_20]|nr:MAG: hypothetical protein BRD20_08095 [Halobacteriales archaeon SW_8_65_20]
MEESVAGFKRRGSWGDIVEHGERVTRALRELLDEENDSLAEWNEWRPKQHERLDEDVNEKTAAQASVEPDDALERWRESAGHLARAADSAGRKALRKVEGAVYRNVMTRIAPYYFDNELVSANVTRNGTDEYALEINVNDDDLKIRVSNKLADYEQSVDRWHVDTEKVTEVAEAVEGVEPPDAQDTGDQGVTEGQSHPTTN